MVSGAKLKEYRKQRKVSSTELAAELKKGHTSYVTRLEGRNLTPLEFAEAVAAIERLVERRAKRQTGIDEVLVPTIGAPDAA